jgi:hypothetical protein
MIHVMTPARRAAFLLMAAKARLKDERDLAGHPIAFFWESEVMTRGMARTLESMGWLTRCPGRHGRPTTVRLTEVGYWILMGASDRRIKSYALTAARMIGR